MWRDSQSAATEGWGERGRGRHAAAASLSVSISLISSFILTPGLWSPHSTLTGIQLATPPTRPATPVHTHLMLSTTAAHHHLQLFGLSSTDPAASLYTCVRELVENALDATTNGTVADLDTLHDHVNNARGHSAVELSSSHRIDISLQPVDQTRTRWRLRVVDDGCGFADGDLERLSGLFSSSKGTGGDQSAPGGVHADELGGAHAGIFGIGLKSVLIWARLTSPHEPVEIRTTQLECPHCSVVRVQLSDADAGSGAGSSAGSGAPGLRPIISHERIPKPAGSLALAQTHTRSPSKRLDAAPRQ